MHEASVRARPIELCWRKKENLKKNGAPPTKLPTSGAQSRSSLGACSFGRRSLHRANKESLFTSTPNLPRLLFVARRSASRALRVGANRNRRRLVLFLWGRISSTAPSSVDRHRAGVHRKSPGPERRPRARDKASQEDPTTL